MGLRSVTLHGCMLGLKAKGGEKSGWPIKKPWTIKTDHMQLIEQFDPVKCPGGHNHAPCEGRHARQSENYTQQMVNRIHRAHELRARDIINKKVPLPEIPVTPEQK